MCQKRRELSGGGSCAELQAGLWLSSRGGEDAEVLLEGWRDILLMNLMHMQKAGNTQVSRWESVSTVICPMQIHAERRKQKQNPYRFEI